MADITMPKLGADMTAGTLVCWRKQPGDTVKRGDIIAEVETDKGVIEVEAFISGVVEKLLARPDDRVPVGTVLAVIREDGVPSAAAVTDRPSPLPATRPAARTAVTPAASRVAATIPETGRLRISPSARVLAEKLGVDPARIQGTGRDGAITREDIERAAAAPAPSPAEDRSARMRQAIAAAMSRSKREIPHYYLSATIDIHRALAWLAEENKKRLVTERLLPGVLLLKAVALGLREVRELNGIWDGGRTVPSEAIHVGVAISLRKGGLIAPALHHTDRLGLDDLMAQFRDLVTRARSGALRSSELSDPTITVTCLGEQGVEAVYGVIYPPQVALVGFGKIVERPWVVGGQVVPRPVVTATLSADHRVSDGHRGGLFLAAVDRFLQEPSKL
jgi:pyruvate dehydrogenase E2 component (dihydrolipoamide acetyltransferase)